VIRNDDDIDAIDESATREAIHQAPNVAIIADDGVAHFW
jgi:hypothetical protein